jgi:alkanesulfonate monooxygenase SsuD/methylene tetrahydromethanopterin reductase-like flavin-dependent oxidoreductase (luciferase family)
VSRVGLLLGSACPPELVPGLAARAEELGFAEIWLSEDYFTTGGVAAAGAALAATRTIPVATGVVSAMARHPAVLAMEAATLARLHPGRFRLGVGLGVREWLAQMGVDPGSPLTAMRETILALRALLAGETVTLTGRYHRFDEIALEHSPERPPPILAAATAPKMLALSGEIADGTVLSVLASPAYVRWACQRIKDGLARRPAVAEHPVTTFALCSVAADPAEARARIRPLASLYLALEPRGPLTDAYGISDELARIVEQTGANPAKVDDALPHEWLEDLVVAGDPFDCAAKLERLLDAGSTTVAVFPTPPERSKEIIEILGGRVLPELARREPARLARGRRSAAPGSDLGGAG